MSAGCSLNSTEVKDWSKVTDRERLVCNERGYQLEDDYLGGGTTGRVFLAKPNVKLIASNERLKLLSLPDKQLKVAIKIIYLDVGLLLLRKLSQSIPDEIGSMNRAYGHENILKLLDVFVSCKRVFLVMEHAANGTLYDILQDVVYVDEERARTIFTQIVRGVRCMHDLNMAHRDIKLDNILVTEEGEMKLADFGFALDVTRRTRRGDDDDGAEEFVTGTMCGTPAFVAPEVFAGSGRGYDPVRADLWSLGVLVYVLVNGRYPFAGETLEEITAQHKLVDSLMLDFRDGISSPLMDLIYSLMSREPSQRPATGEILDHCWMQAPRKKTSTTQLFMQIFRRKKSSSKSNLFQQLRKVRNSPIARFREEFVRNFLLQRVALLNEGLRHLQTNPNLPNRHRLQVGVCIPLLDTSSAGQPPVNEVWRIYNGGRNLSSSRPLERDERERRGERAGAVGYARLHRFALSALHGRRCAVRSARATSSFALPTITWALHELPVVADWLELANPGAMTWYEPRSELEIGIRRCNTVGFRCAAGDSPPPDGRDVTQVMVTVPSSRCAEDATMATCDGGVAAAASDDDFTTESSATEDLCTSESSRSAKSFDVMTINSCNDHIGNGNSCNSNSMLKPQHLRSMPTELPSHCQGLAAEANAQSISNHVIEKAQSAAPLDEDVHNIISQSSQLKSSPGRFEEINGSPLTDNAMEQFTKFASERFHFKSNDNSCEDQPPDEISPPAPSEQREVIPDEQTASARSGNAERDDVTEVLNRLLATIETASVAQPRDRCHGERSEPGGDDSDLRRAESRYSCGDEECTLSGGEVGKVFDTSGDCDSASSAANKQCGGEGSSTFASRKNDDKNVAETISGAKTAPISCETPCRNEDSSSAQDDRNARSHRRCAENVWVRREGVEAVDHRVFPSRDSCSYTTCGTQLFCDNVCYNLNRTQNTGLFEKFWRAWTEPKGKSNALRMGSTCDGVRAQHTVSCDNPCYEMSE